MHLAHRMVMREAGTIGLLASIVHGHLRRLSRKTEEPPKEKGLIRFRRGLVTCVTANC
jgi:hypothetical protein